MNEAVRHVSAAWNPESGQVSIRIEEKSLDRSQELSLAVGDVQALIMILLFLSGQAGGTSNLESATVPVAADAMGIGETADGDIILQFGVGQTALALSLPSEVGIRLGRELMSACVSRSMN